MRTHHALHTLQQFPVYSAAFVADNVLALGGGGGSSRSGIKNKLRLYKIKSDTDVELLHELELEKDEDAPMSMAADLPGQRLICGINSPTEQLEKGINENCRAYSVKDDKIQPLSTARTLSVSVGSVDDYQKVTALSQDGSFVVAAGSNDLSVLTFPQLVPAASSLKTDSEIYDAAFSSHQLAVATTKNVLVYSVPTTMNGDSTKSSKKKKGKSSAARPSGAVLELLKTLSLPSLPGIRSGTSTFRAIRFHPSDNKICYGAINYTPDRVKGSSKSIVKRAFVVKWNTETWESTKLKEVGKKGLTCFDVSSNGKWLAYGTADLSIGVLDAKTLAPLLTILRAHDFPPTVIRFSPNCDTLVSGSADNSLRIVALPANLGSHDMSVSRSTMVFVALFVLLLSIILSLYYRGSLPFP